MVEFRCSRTGFPILRLARLRIPSPSNTASKRRRPTRHGATSNPCASFGRAASSSRASCTKTMPGRAVGLGANGIYVSNHGGRQLDRAPSPIEVLPGICAAVGDQATVLMDSGVRRGSDVILARCLCAEATFVGRATLYRAVAGGLPGAQRAIEILQNEIDLTLGALGCPAASDLGSHILLDSGGRMAAGTLVTRRGHTVER